MTSHWQENVDRILRVLYIATTECAAYTSWQVSVKLRLNQVNHYVWIRRVAISTQRQRCGMAAAIVHRSRHLWSAVQSTAGSTAPRFHQPRSSFSTHPPPRYQPNQHPYLINRVPRNLTRRPWPLARSVKVRRTWRRHFRSTTNRLTAFVTCWCGRKTSNDFNVSLMASLSAICSETATLSTRYARNCCLQFEYWQMFEQMYEVSKQTPD